MNEGDAASTVLYKNNSFQRLFGFESLRFFEEDIWELLDLKTHWRYMRRDDYHSPHELLQHAAVGSAPASRVRSHVSTNPRHLLCL